jgi:hypothetical protein
MTAISSAANVAGKPFHPHVARGHAGGSGRGLVPRRLIGIFIAAALWLG